MARWNHALSGIIGPDVFIPVAEEMGLIGKLSEQAIGAAELWVAEDTAVRALLEDAWPVAGIGLPPRARGGVEAVEILQRIDGVDAVSRF